MIILGILIMLTFTVNCLLLVYIREEQKEYHEIIYKVQDDQWDDITQIRRAVRAIDRRTRREGMDRTIKNK